MSPQPCFPLAGAACPWKEPVWVTPSGTRAGRIPPSRSISFQVFPSRIQVVSAWLPKGVRVTGCCQVRSTCPVVSETSRDMDPSFTSIRCRPRNWTPSQAKGRRREPSLTSTIPYFRVPLSRTAASPSCSSRPPPSMSYFPGPNSTRPWRSTNHISPLSFTKVPQRVMGNTASFRSSTITWPVRSM